MIEILGESKENGKIKGVAKSENIQREEITGGYLLTF